MVTHALSQRDQKDLQSPRCCFNVLNMDFEQRNYLNSIPNDLLRNLSPSELLKQLLSTVKEVKHTELLPSCILPIPVSRYWCDARAARRALAWPASFGRAAAQDGAPTMTKCH